MINKYDCVRIVQGEHKGKMGIVMETPHSGYKTIRVEIIKPDDLKYCIHDEVDIPDDYLEPVITLNS